MTTSWFVITMLCNKRVPKSLTLFYINTVDYTHLHHSLNTYFHFFLQFVTHYVTFKVRKSCFRWGGCLCVEITCKNLFVTSHGHVGGLDVVYFIIYKNMFTSLTTLWSLCGRGVTAVTADLWLTAWQSSSWCVIWLSY